MYIIYIFFIIRLGTFNKNKYLIYNVIMINQLKTMIVPMTQNIIYLNVIVCNTIYLLKT